MPNYPMPNLSKARYRAGLTYKALGIITGLSVHNIKNWEVEEIETRSPDVVLRLAIALQTTPHYLLGLTDEIPVPMDSQDIDYESLRVLKILGQRRRTLHDIQYGLEWKSSDL